MAKAELNRHELQQGEALPGDLIKEVELVADVFQHDPLLMNCWCVRNIHITALSHWADAGVGAYIK